jgi:rsbT co-antagonist protein RsbR
MPLVQAVESARLMGARTIVTGLSADIAAALVAQELDLSAITVAGDLQAGIEVAVGLLD